jgi:hypothetical protein
VRVSKVWPGRADGEGDDACGWVPGGEVGVNWTWRASSAAARAEGYGASNPSVEPVELGQRNAGR